MTHAEELAKIAARLAEIAKEMETKPASSKICAVGEKKMIGGNMYVKRSGSCESCAFNKRNKCQNPGNFIDKAIEDGGSECEGTNWKLVRK